MFILSGTYWMCSFKRYTGASQQLRQRLEVSRSKRTHGCVVNDPRCCFPGIVRKLVDLSENGRSIRNGAVAESVFCSEEKTPSGTETGCLGSGKIDSIRRL